MTKGSAKDVPVFWGHGTADPVVQYECWSPLILPPAPKCACTLTDYWTDGKRSIELLTKKLNFPLLPSDTTFQRPGLRFESYPGMGHSSSDREIRDLKEWLAECLKD